MDGKLRYDVFTILGFNNWKNAYMALPKHDGKSITSVGQHMKISTIKE